MASETKSPAANETGDTGIDWNNPNNAQIDDANAATGTANGSSDPSNHWKTFGFSNVSGTVDGIEVKVTLADSFGDGGLVYGIRISWDGGVTWTHTQALPRRVPDSGTVNSKTVYVVPSSGGSTDKWGRSSWSVSDFTDANLRVDVFVDSSLSDTYISEAEFYFIEVTVYFTATGGGVTVAPAGVSSTGNVGSLSVITNANISLTGNSTTAVVGTLSAIGEAIASALGVSSAGAVGNLSVIGMANVAVTGVAATGGIGTLTITADAVVSLSGMNATGQVGSVSVSISGAVTVAITGVAATGNVGALSVIGMAAVSPNSVAATGQVGTITATVAQTITVTGVSANGQAGTMTIDAGAVVSIIGVVSTTVAGTVTIPTPNGIVYLDGIITITPVQDGSITLTPVQDAMITLKPVFDGNISIN